MYYKDTRTYQALGKIAFIEIVRNLARRNSAANLHIPSLFAEVCAARAEVCARYVRLEVTSKSISNVMCVQPLACAAYVRRHVRRHVRTYARTYPRTYPASPCAHTPAHTSAHNSQHNCAHTPHPALFRRVLGTSKVCPNLNREQRTCTLFFYADASSQLRRGRSKRL